MISREWIQDILNENTFSSNCPKAWRKWVKTGYYDVLKTEPTRKHRKKMDQLPSNSLSKSMIEAIYNYFKKDSIGFEYCSAKIARIMDKNIVSLDVTRPWRDGGRDAIGVYRIGSDGDYIKVEFALEAKCFKLNSGVGIKETSRLISRLKHRQFGILVTTSYVSEQAYKEIREDEHPVIIIAAEDIAQILINAGIKSSDDVIRWLETNFPRNTE